MRIFVFYQKPKVLHRLYLSVVLYIFIHFLRPRRDGYLVGTIFPRAMFAHAFTKSKRLLLGVVSELNGSAA